MEELVRFRKSDPIWGKRTANKWPQKCDGGPYNGADSVHWSFIYIYIKELPIYKKESGCIPPRLGDTLSDSRFDFENLTQSEARELPTSGHASVMEGPRILLIVFIALYYTYTMAKHQYLRNRMIVYHRLMAKHCRTAGSISKIWPDLRQENCQQVDTQVWWRALESCW